MLAAPERTSDVLERLAAGDKGTLTFGEVLQALGDRAFAMMILVCALPNCLPMIPGVSTVTGFAIAILSLQMVAGRAEPWLPARIRDHAFARADFARLVTRVVPWIRKVERLAIPRMRGLTGPAGVRIVGLVIAILAGVLMLPLSVVGNVPPAIAIAVICLGLVERDGLIVAAGYAGGAVATLFVGGLVAGIVIGLQAIV